MLEKCVDLELVLDGLVDKVRRVNRLDVHAQTLELLLKGLVSGTNNRLEAEVHIVRAPEKIKMTFVRKGKQLRCGRCGEGKPGK